MDFFGVEGLVVTNEDLEFQGVWIFKEQYEEEGQMVSPGLWFFKQVDLEREEPITQYTTGFSYGSSTVHKIQASYINTDSNNRFVSDTEMSSLQPKTDNLLSTNDKTVVGGMNEINSIAKGATQAVSYGNISTMVTALNAMSASQYRTGQNIYIVTLNVPDLWISSVEQSSVPYTYVDDTTFVNALTTNGYVQVGYYKLSAMETNKVDLTNYYTKSQTDTALAGKVGFTDYANVDDAGVICVGGYGSSLDASSHRIYAEPFVYSIYANAGGTIFISKGTLENIKTDLLNRAMQGNVKTTMDAVAVANAQYYLGEQTTVAIVLPSSANAGETITCVFYSGATATALSISGSYLGTLPTPATNQRIELNLLFDSQNWCLLSNVLAVGE